MISIIIINYRQKTFTVQCVKSIYSNFKSYPFEVIIVNNSPGENLNQLTEEYNNLRIIENENIGFSQANNVGVRNSKGDYLFFLNADTIIQSDFLKDFIDAFNNKDFGAAGMKLYNEDGTFQLSFWHENTFFNEIKNKRNENRFRRKELNFINAVEEDYSKIRQADWVTGAAIIIRKSVYLDSGGFDEKFFLFYEDADICKRLNEMQQPVYFFPFSKIVHFKGENVSKEFKSSSYYFSKASQLRYYCKHNNITDNILIRVYLFVKFFILFVFTFKKINLKILLLTLGIKA